ncbi:MAG: MvaI/BcnI family restriction endonuclease, partial [Aquificaceae bacterium]|nr:MvaI/BcnI family restriction endonuclease [Aquificaceae bacterium]
MRKQDLIKRLREIKAMGFVPSMRRGNTGIGYTFEKLLGVSENNIPIPDLGGRLEIKTTRLNSKSMITLFTFNRGVWRINLKDLVSTYGYKDKSGRVGLKLTLFCDSISQNMSLGMRLNESLHSLEIIDINTKEILGSYSLYVVVGKFMQKLGRVLYVLAEVKTENAVEKFYYNEFYLCQEPDYEKFVNA